MYPHFSAKLATIQSVITTHYESIITAFPKPHDAAIVVTIIEAFRAAFH